MAPIGISFGRGAELSARVTSSATPGEQPAPVIEKSRIAATAPVATCFCQRFAVDIRALLSASGGLAQLAAATEDPAV